MPAACISGPYTDQPVLRSPTIVGRLQFGDVVTFDCEFMGQPPGTPFRLVNGRFEVKD
jgi:hypothetical protein